MKRLLVTLLWLSAAGAVLPMLWLALSSITKPESLLLGRVGSGLTLANYWRVIAGTDFLVYIVNSLLVASLAALLTVALGLAAAYALTRYRVAGKGALITLLLGIPLFPQISILIYLYLQASRLQLINTYTALVLPYAALSLPLAIWYLVAALDEIPRELDYAAWLDGCSPLQYLTAIVLPLARPALVSVGLLIFLVNWNEFIIALVLTADARSRTAPVGLAMFQGAHFIPWGDIAAATMLVLAPVALLVIYAQRQLVAGLSRGAVK